MPPDAASPVLDNLLDVLAMAGTKQPWNAESQRVANAAGQAMLAVRSSSVPFFDLVWAAAMCMTRSLCLSAGHRAALTADTLALPS